MSFKDFTINGLRPFMKLPEAEKVCGKLFIDSSLPQKTPNHPVAWFFEGNHNVNVFTNVEGNGSTDIGRVKGTSLEADGEVLFELGCSQSRVKDALGSPHSISGETRQFWSYKKLGKNQIDLSIMFDEGQVTNIETMWTPPGW
jgi:hypothetical protein